MVLRHPGDAQLLDQAVDLPGAHAVDVCLLDDGDERLLGALARFQEARTFKEPVVSVEVEVPSGQRVLVGQRIDGRVAVIDRPAGTEGRVYLVERAVPSQAELDAIVSEYCERSQLAGEPSLLASRRILEPEAESI